MGKPQVTLTLAGDESKLTKAFDNVGSSSRNMADNVGASSKRVAEETAGAYDRAGEAADGAEGKAQGFSDTLTGTSDIMAGAGQIASGNLFEGFVTLGQGAADLAGGLASFLIPALKNLSLENLKNVAEMARSTAAAGLQKGAQLASAAATNVMAVAQRALNLAMRANPIGLIITALTLLVGGLIYAYKHSETFRNIVNGAFRAVLGVVQSVVTWIRNNWPLLLKILTGPIGLAVGAIRTHKDSILGFFKSVPGAITGYFKGIGSTIASPFRAAFDGIKSAWNNTVGGKGFEVPGWIPGLGGKDFRIPYFHTGGIVSGAMGTETLAMLKAGERVVAGSNSGGSVITVELDVTGDLTVLKKKIRIGGGDVQKVLGP